MNTPDTSAETPRGGQRRVCAALLALCALVALVATLVLTQLATSADAEPLAAPAGFVEPLSEYGASCDGVDSALLAAQVRVETNFEKNRVSAAGAVGYVQMMPRDWDRYGHGGDPNDPRDAVRALTEMDCSLLAVAHARGCHGEDAIRVMLALYNAGEAAVRGCTVPTNGETDRYVARVLALR